MQNLKEKILHEIESGKVKPKPKWLFAFKSLGLVFSLLFILLFTFYILAFLGFIMSERDWVQESTYSLSGLYFLLSTLPLTIIFLAIFMVIVASLTAYKYGLSYKKPFIYTLLVIIVLLFTTRYVFVLSGLQKYIKEKAFAEKVQLVPNSWREMREGVKNAQLK